MRTVDSLIHSLMTAISNGDSDGLGALLDPALVSHGALGDVHGPDGFERVMLANINRAFPDAELEATGIISDGDMVSWRVVGTGTHEGAFLGIPASGKRVRIQGIHQARITEGRLIEHWQGPDILAMLVDMDELPPGRPRDPQE